MSIRQIIAALVLTSALSASSAEAFHHRRYVPCNGPRLDYAPYAIAPVASYHGPAAFSPGVYGAPVPAIRPPALYGPATFYRGYYAPLSYGYLGAYRFGYGPGFASPYGFSRFSYGYGQYVTRYGLYGGSYARVPLTVGYPYATGYLSTVRPIQPYRYSYQATTSFVAPTIVQTAYTPCVYGAYGLGGF